MNTVGRTRGRGRGVALWLAVLLLAGVAGHALLWRWAEQRLQQGFDEWAAGRRSQGWTVRAGEAVRAGWPLAARLVVKQVAVEGGQSSIPGGFAWGAEHVTLSLALLQPRDLAVTPDGAQHLRLGGLPDVRYTADSLRIDVPLDPGVPAHAADLAASGLRAGLPGSPEGGGLTVGLLRAHAEMHPGAAEGEPALALQGSAEAIVLPPGLPWALGGRLSSVSLDGVLTGPLPRSPALAQRATAWRDGGGTLEIQRLALGWGPLGLTASATLALDQRLQPMGTGTARIIGYAETLDALAAGGAINPRAALAAKAIGGLIAAMPQGGGPAEIEVPLTLQDRSLSIRQIPLARLPPLQWPG